MDVRDLKGATALVTGAASGIGRETAYALARRGADLAICDVDEPGLAESERRIRELGRAVLARRVDVADRAAMSAFAEEVHRGVEAVDLLVNNAGVAVGARFLDTPLEDWEWVVRINLFGVVHGCHFFVPPMVRRRRPGHVVNVASMIGFVATSPLAAYAATKFAVVGLSEALREELRPFGIGVTAVCPGIIDTAIPRTARLRGEAADPARRERMMEFYRRRGYGPERVAENVLRAVQRDRAIAPISPEAWAFYYLKRLVPGLLPWLNRRLAARSWGR
jgi:NAD(P)-dependent dehydrogenase (short-subunit alcohol dehydrogenase family)